jgi:hypothetical protein
LVVNKKVANPTQVAEEEEEEEATKTPTFTLTHTTGNGILLVHTHKSIEA